LLLLPGCASQDAYRGYLEVSRSNADAYYSQKPLVSVTCNPTCSFGSLEVRAPLTYQQPQQIVNENAGIAASFADLLGNAIPALGLRRPAYAADVIRAAGEAYKAPNVTTTTTTGSYNPATNTATGSYNPATNTATGSYNPATSTTTSNK
jgi:hypothetical protein